MELMPMDDPADDLLLSKFLDETEKQLVQSLPPPLPVTNVVNNTVKTINNTQKLGVPMMYFPNSNITINYHFHNWEENTQTVMSELQKKAKYDKLCVKHLQMARNGLWFCLFCDTKMDLVMLFLQTKMDYFCCNTSSSKSAEWFLLFFNFINVRKINQIQHFVLCKKRFYLRSKCELFHAHCTQCCI